MGIFNVAVYNFNNRLLYIKILKGHTKMTIEKLKSDAFVSTDYKRFYTKTISGIEFDPEEFINKTNELIEKFNMLKDNANTLFKKQRGHRLTIII